MKIYVQGLVIFAMAGHAYGQYSGSALSSDTPASYSGPAILSRGEAPSPLKSAEVRFQPFAEVQAVYDTGLAAVKLSDSGQLATSSSFGARLGWGISGSHKWRHTSVGIHYHGSWTEYSSSVQRYGVDQSFMLGLTHQFTRRTSLVIQQSAGGFTRDYGAGSLSQTAPFDPSTSYVPATDYFDNRTIYLTSRADLIVQKTARLSFSLGGTNFLNLRSSQALSNAVGTEAHGDTQYRLSRKSTIGAGYNFNHFTYSRSGGGTDAHGATASFAYALNKRTEFSGYGGAVRVESKFFQTIAVDPVIAQLLGIQAAAQIFHTISYHPSFGARLARIVPHGMLYVSGGEGMTPGNGLFMTSFDRRLVGGYNYTGMRRWTLAAQGGLSRAYSEGTISGGYNSVTAGVSASRKLGVLGLTTAFTLRQYSSPDFANYNRLVYGAVIGLSFSPGDVPAHVW